MRLTHTAKQAKKIPLGSSCLSQLSRHCLQSPTHYSSVLDDSSNPHRCTSPSEHKLKTIKKHGKRPQNFTTAGNGGGWEGMASHCGKASSSCRAPGGEWRCKQGQGNSRGSTISTPGLHHLHASLLRTVVPPHQWHKADVASLSDHCTVKL